MCDIHANVYSSNDDDDDGNDDVDDDQKPNTFIVLKVKKVYPTPVKKVLHYHIKCAIM